MNCIITGASRGLGFEIAKYFKNQGYNVCLISRHAEKLLEAAKQIGTDKDDLVIVADLSEEGSVDRIVAELNAAKWLPQIIINNAAQYLEDNIKSARINSLQGLLQLNALSGFDLVRRFLLDTNCSLTHVISIGSVLSKGLRDNALSYTVSKHMQDVFFQFVAKQSRLLNVKSTMIVPGSMNTTSWDGIDAPREKFVQPSDIVKLIDTLLNLSSACWIEEIVVKPIEESV